MFRLLALLLPRNWGRLSRAIFGDFKYRPPRWAASSARGVVDSMQRRPGAWASVIVLVGAAIAGRWYYQQWWEAHKPRPTPRVELREVAGTVSAPTETVIPPKGKPVVQPAVIRFSGSIAPIEKVGKPATGDVALKPEIAGEWKWTDDRTLSFMPAADWPAGVEYQATLSAATVPKEVQLKDGTWKFSTRELRPSFNSIEFYTDPQDPAVHQVVAEIRTNHPVSVKAVEQHLTVAVLGGTPLFNQKGRAPDAFFTVTEGKDQRQFFIRSARITIPEKEDFVKLSLREGIVALNGGKPATEVASLKVRVPDKFSGFSIGGVRTEIIRTSEGDPEQFLFVETKGYAEGAEIEKHLLVWFIPPFEETENKKLPTAGAVSEADIQRFQMKPVTLKRVETEKDEGAPVSTAHAFKFLLEKPGRLLVRVTRGATALGGFELARDFATYSEIATFPREVEVIGRGGVLALNGEKKIGIKSRGVPWMRITLARVPFSQVQHLARFTNGDFQSPYFRGWIDESNIAHFHREVRKIPMRNEFEASYTTFDFSAAVQRADVSDPDASRGMFFITVEGVQPAKHSKKRLEGDDVMTDWKPLRHGDAIEDEAEADAKPDDAAEEQPQRFRGDDDDEQVGVSEKRFILVTDMGLLVKRSADGTRDVFLQSVQRGEPVGGANVLVLAKNGEFITQTATSAEGRVKLPKLEHLKAEKKPVAIITRLGNDVAFIPFDRPDRLLDFSRFDVGGVLASEKETLDAHLFTERGIYRPGDEIHISAIVRRRDWQGKLDGLPLEVEVFNSKQQSVFSATQPLPADGFMEIKAKTEENDPTGTYVAMLYLVKDENNRIALGRTMFRVEDFQPDRMKGELTFNKPDGGGWITPDNVSATLSLKTLFGFPAAGRNVKARLELNAAQFAFEQFPDFTFHNRLLDATKRLAGEEVNLGEQKTNDAGLAEFRLALERFEGGCFQLSMLAEAFEADGGRSVRAGRSVLVAPYSFVIGSKADGSLDYITKDSARNLKLIGIGSDLKPRAVEHLSQRLLQVRNVSVLTKQPNGNYAYVSTVRESQLADAPFELKSDGASFALPTGEVGDFRFELRDADNNVVCAVPFSVVGKGDSSRSLERDAELELTLARGEWKSGEELELNYRAPYTGAGLITIEREGVFASKWFKAASTSGTERITVPQGIEGTAYVNVSFVRGLDSPEIFMSPLSYAVQPFTVNPDARRMSVTLDAPQIVKPGQVLKIGYQASKPSRIAIFAVDAGIHQITDYKLPDPLQHFLRKRAHEVQTEQLLDLILPEFSLLKNQKAFGGDEGALKMNLNPFKRRRDPPVVFWSGLVQADTNRREVSYTVPDYFAGQLNIMAVAVAPDAIGTAQTKSIVRGPMVLSPNVPVFAAPGDEFIASLTVANNLDGANASGAIGLTLAASQHLEIVGAGSQTLEVAPGKEGTARFRVRARESLGGAELTFRATAGSETMERRATLSVRPSQPYMTNVQSGYFRLPKQDVKVARDMFPQFRKTDAMASVLPIGLARGLERYLSEYPHGCSEQITSRAMGRLLVAGEADFGYDKAEAVRALDAAFALLRTRQHSNGGFGYWDSACDDRFDFLSVYVTHFLTEAREAGYAVPSALIDGARNRMKQMARLEIGSLDDARLQAAAIYLLTRHGEVTTNFLLNLRDTLDKRYKDRWQPDVAASYVASTYALLKQQKEARALIDAHRREVKNAPAPSWSGYYYIDPQLWRTQDFALLCRHFPEIASGFGYNDLAPITEPIAQGRFNTITAAHTILALKAYSQLAQKSDVKLAIREVARSGGEPKLLVPESSGLLNVPFSVDAGMLRFELNQTGRADLGAFYQVTESGFDKGAPDAKVADGLEVFREIADAEGKPVEKLRVGDGATLRIRVRNISPADQTNVAVLDLLPGGFEVEPDALKPGRRTVPGADFTEVREDRNIFFCNIAKGEVKTFSYRVKPVAAGSFVIPPVFAESMYDRGIKGRAGGGRIEVESAP